MHATPPEPCFAPLAMPGRLRAEHIRGVADVLLRARELAPLVAATPQEHELGDLAYFFSKPARLRSAPHLLLLYRRTAADGPEVLAGGVLLQTFPLLRFLPGVYFVQNRHGRRVVFGPLAHRVELALAAAEQLAREGARSLTLDFDLGPMPDSLNAENAGESAFVRALATAQLRLTQLVFRRYQWALHPGIRQFGLALAPDFETSIAGLGKKNRNNLRRTRRLVLGELGCTFVPHVQISPEAFHELARSAHFPTSAAVTAWRFDALARFPQTFLAGLRDPEGRWLSVAGCRRHGSAVEVDWQMNRRGFERYSLSTALRACQIDHEGRAGTQTLFFEGGAYHHMLKYFRLRQVYTLALRRGSFPVPGLLGSVLGRVRPQNQITAALTRPWLRWRTATPPRER